MQHRLLIAFRAGTVVVDESAHGLSLDSSRGSVTFDSPGPGLRLALQTLASGGATEDELAAVVHGKDGFTALARFYYYLKGLEACGLLRYTLKTGERPLLTLEPVSSAFRLDVPAVDPAQPFVLSRFAYCRRLQSILVLESPLAHARVLLHGSAGGALVADLAETLSGRELSARIPGIDVETAQQALGLLAGAALVCQPRQDGSTPEDGDEALQQWEFHDLLFHARSRPGRHDSPSGAIYRFVDRVPPLPAIKRRMSDDVIWLDRPDMEQLMESDLPLTRAIEQRVSVREHGDLPITAAQLGEFLYRTARVRSVIEPGPANNRPYARSSRPYPGGGAAYELEIYLTVDACDGIAAGLYHYEPAEHALSKVSGPTANTEALLRRAAGSSGMAGNPQVLITLAARFQRLSWKYESIAYAAVLKNVGVLYQTMYLVATAMNLAPCALGTGNTAVFMEATGLRYLEESSVGEFILGSRRS